MADFDVVENFSYGTVSVAPSPASSGTTLTLQSGEGALFPTPGATGGFNVTLYPADTGPLLSNAEIVRVTDVTGDVLTFTRAQEGTSAKSVAVGWQVAFAPTAKTMQDIFDAINAIAPGSGDVVGPASSVDNRPALFDGVTGKLLKQAPAALGSAAFVATSAFDAAGSASAAQAAAEATAANANNLSSGTVPAGRMPALTGDVTTSAGSVATTIANDAVTYAKMQNVSAASRLIGRGSAGGAGNPEEITLGAGLSMTGSTLAATGGGGGVSSVDSGYGLTGGPITGSGTLASTAAEAGLDVKAQFGALGDGQQIQTASITSGTDDLTGTGFVVGDVGKIIVVEGAGASGLDLVTTISAYVSGTAVTLAANAGTTVSNKTATWGTDDTSAIQDAIDAISTIAGGTIFFPDGIYMIGGSLVTSANGQTYNAQLTLPYRVESLPSSVLSFIGQSQPIGPYLQYSGAPVPSVGAILFSTIAGSGTRPAVIGSPHLSSGVFSHFTPVFKNLTFRGRTNPSVDALDLSHVECCELDHVNADVGRNTYDLPVPTNSGQVGFRLPGRNNDARVTVRSCYVMGQYTGIQLNEHTVIDDGFVQSCYIGIQSTEAYHEFEIYKVVIAQCPYGIQFTGDSYLTGTIDFERYTNGGPSWMNPTYDIDDASNYARGHIFFHSVQAAVGANGVLTINGAENLSLESALKSPAWTVLTDGATITYDLPIAATTQRAKVTLGGNRTLAITGAREGMQGDIFVTQDGTGSRTLALPSGSYVSGNGVGVAVLTATPGATDLLKWRYNGSAFYWEVALDFTTASNYDPSADTSLRLWLDPDLESYADNDPVGTATDWSSQTNDGTASGSARPTFKTGIVNSLPVFRFDGSANVLVNASMSQGLDACVMSMVVRETTAVDSVRFFTMPNASTDYQANAIEFDAGTSGSGKDAAVTASFGGAVFDQRHTGSKPMSGFHILTAWVDGSGNAKFYFDGTLVGTNTSVSLGTATQGYTVGAGSLSLTPTLFLTGDIAQVLVGTGAYLAATVIGMIRYQGARFGITVP